MSVSQLHTEERSVTNTECRALVDRIVTSLELRRSARLRAFLLYVSDQFLTYGKTVIHEQEIGAAVFGRPTDYDTGIDNIVRVNATELRKRLEHFFAAEGRTEELTLEIQRGSYTPTFARRAPGDVSQPSPETATQQTLISAPVPEPPSTSLAREVPPAFVAERVSLQPQTRTAFPLWQSLCGLLLLVSGTLAWQLHSLALRSSARSGEPATRAFWSQFYSADNETDILLADTSLAMAEDMLQRQIALQDYLNYNYKRMAEDPGLSPIRRDDLARVLERNNGSIADFQVAAQILQLDQEHRFRLESARSYSPEAAKRHSLVLIGSRQSNPWVSLFGDKMNFDLEYDEVARRPYVVNRAPQPGESREYPLTGNAQPDGTGYAVIAFMPDLSGKGRALVIEGTDSQATGAAGDFITSDESLAQLEKKFSPNTIPYFEVLLRTSQLSGTPLHGELIASRIYQDTKAR